MNAELQSLVEWSIRMVAALALGGAIGIERQWRQRMAGVRTNALVSLGAATFTVFSLLFPDEMSPTRVAAQVVSGIGFLGAGVIMRHGIHVHGLTTAATLWCAAAVGVLAGTGRLDLAIIVTGLVLVANLLLRPVSLAIEHRSQDQSGHPWSGHRVRLEWEPRDGHAEQMRAMLWALAQENRVEVQRIDRVGESRWRADIIWPNGPSAKAFDEGLNRLTHHPEMIAFRQRLTEH